MKIRAKIAALFVMAGVILAATWTFLVREQPAEIPPSDFPSEVTYAGMGAKSAFAFFYEPEDVSVEPNVAPYALPLDLATVSNFDEVNSILGLSVNQRNLLSVNGFVVVPWGQDNDVVIVYNRLKSENIPIFVTSDTLLHLYHIQ
ncbi:MAG: hypothetical protein DRN83_03555, partial [Hadesarchaea archaeon]